MEYTWFKERQTSADLAAAEPCTKIYDCGITPTDMKIHCSMNVLTIAFIMPNAVMNRLITQRSSFPYTIIMRSFLVVFLAPFFSTSGKFSFMASCLVVTD